MNHNAITYFWRSEGKKTVEDMITFAAATTPFGTRVSARDTSV